MPANQRSRSPGYRIVWSGSPNRQRQITALCIALGIAVPPLVPRPGTGETPPEPADRAADETDTPDETDKTGR